MKGEWVIHNWYMIVTVETSIAFGLLPPYNQGLYDVHLCQESSADDIFHDDKTLILISSIHWNWNIPEFSLISVS